MQIDGDNIIRMVRVLVPDLVPEMYHGTQLVGHSFHESLHEPLQSEFQHCLEQARTTRQPQRHRWPSLRNGLSRVGIFEANDRGSVILSVFAEAEEAAAHERRHGDRRADCDEEQKSGTKDE